MLMRIRLILLFHEALLDTTVVTRATNRQALHFPPPHPLTSQKIITVIFASWIIPGVGLLLCGVIEHCPCYGPKGSIVAPRAGAGGLLASWLFRHAAGLPWPVSCGQTEKPSCSQLQIGGGTQCSGAKPRSGQMKTCPKHCHGFMQSTGHLTPIFFLHAKLYSGR